MIALPLDIEAEQRGQYLYIFKARMWEPSNTWSLNIHDFYIKFEEYTKSLVPFLFPAIFTKNVFPTVKFVRKLMFINKMKNLPKKQFSNIYWYWFVCPGGVHSLPLCIAGNYKPFFPTAYFFAFLSHGGGSNTFM